MHGLGHVGTAIVDEDASRRCDTPGAQPGVGGDLVGAGGQGGVGKAQVDEAGTGNLHGGELRSGAQDLDDRRSDLAGIATHTLGRRQGAVTLEIGQVGAIRGRGAGQVDGQTEGTERPGKALVDRASQPAHFGVRPPAVLVWAPASRRNRFPSRLKAAMAGVTSKPTRTSKLEPEVVRVARGMTMPSIRSTA